MRTEIESLQDPRAWARAAIAECLEVWNRVGARYARRLRERDRLCEPVDDVLTLVARRIAPLPTPRLRPLPVDHLDPLARAFNGLPAADRYALRRLRMLGGVRGARAAHLASALDRLVAAHRRDRTLHARDARHAPDGTPEGDRPSPESGDGRSLHALDSSDNGAPSDTQLPSDPLM